MNGNDSQRRDDLADAIATIVLEHGLDALALRGLAHRLSTSGRMLLYYFGTKDALVRATLDRITARMRLIQDMASSGTRVTAGQFLSAMMQAGVDPRTAPFMRVWTEAVARAARGEAPYRELVDATVTDWLAWIETRLLPDPDNDARARAVLSIMEGVTILEMARPGTTAAARRLLPALLDQQRARTPRRSTRT